MYLYILKKEGLCNQTEVGTLIWPLPFVPAGLFLPNRQKVISKAKRQLLHHGCKIARGLCKSEHICTRCRQTHLGDKFGKAVVATCHFWNLLTVGFFLPNFPPTAIEKDFETWPGPQVFLRADFGQITMLKGKDRFNFPTLSVKGKKPLQLCSKQDALQYFATMVRMDAKKKKSKQNKKICFCLWVHWNSSHFWLG